MGQQQQQQLVHGRFLWCQQPLCVAILVVRKMFGLFSTYISTASTSSFTVGVTLLCHSLSLILWLRVYSSVVV